MKNNKTSILIRRPECLALTARSKSALQHDIKQGLFCPPIAIGERAVAFIRHEVETIIQARIEQQLPDQIKILVKKLIKNRSANMGAQL